MNKASKGPNLDFAKKWLGTGSVNIFGMPFSGKDTQAHKLAQAIDGEVVAGGDILRQHKDSEKIKQLMSSGLLFPSDFYLEVITPYLSQPELANKPLVMTSLGRWHGEEESVLHAAAESGHPLKAVVILEMDEMEVWRRFEASQSKGDRGLRHDDAQEVLEVRLKEFRDKTIPVINFYRNNGLVIEVDGSADTQTVTNEIIQRLAELANHK